MPQITLEHTSKTADLPIFKFCKFFDGDGGKIFKSNCQTRCFFVPEYSFQIKVSSFNFNLAHQNNICNHPCQFFRFLPAFTSTCQYMSNLRAKIKKPFQPKNETVQAYHCSKSEQKQSIYDLRQFHPAFITVADKAAAAGLIPGSAAAGIVVVLHSDITGSAETDLSSALPILTSHTFLSA